MNKKVYIDSLFQEYRNKLNVLAAERSAIVSEFKSAVESQKINSIKEKLGITTDDK
jgi:hypothetical protein